MMYNMTAFQTFYILTIFWFSEKRPKIGGDIKRVAQKTAFDSLMIFGYYCNTFFQKSSSFPKFSTETS